MAAGKMSKQERDFLKIMSTIPRQLDFIIDLPSDTTTPVYDTETTNIPDNMAMLVYGAKWCFLNKTEGTVEAPAISAALDCTYHVEFHRNDDHEDIILPTNNDLLFLPDKLTLEYGQNSAGECWQLVEWPRSFGERTVTFAENIRMLFATNVDAALITQNHEVFGRLYFDWIPAPSAGSTKLGRLADL